MGRVIVIGTVIVILGLLLTGVVIYLRRQDTKEKAAEKGWALKGDLNRRQEEALIALVNSARQIMTDIRNPPIDAVDYVSYLSPADKSKVEQWLLRFNRERLTN